MGNERTADTTDGDIEALMAEAKALDTMFGANRPVETTDPVPEKALLLNLCRALEREAEGQLPALDQQNLLGLHKSLSALRQQIEQLLRNS